MRITLTAQHLTVTDCAWTGGVSVDDVPAIANRLALRGPAEDLSAPPFVIAVV